MKSTGIIKKFDELGRIVLPMEIRRVFNIGNKDAVEIFIENDMIFIKKYDEVCIFCGSSENLQTFMDKNICTKCANNLKKLK